jgi:hypothetical protein
MAYAFVNQTSAATASNVGSLALPSYTPVAGNTLLLPFYWGNAAAVTISLSDGGVGNTYLPLFTQVVTGASQFWGFYATNVAGLATVITATASSTTAHCGFYLAEYSGIFQLLGSNAVETNGPGTGANACTSGNFLAGGTPVMVWGFNFNVTGDAASSAGTSPIAFTGQTPVWAPLGSGGTTTCALGEDAAYAGATQTIAATFGPSNQFDSYYTAGASFAESNTYLYDTATVAWLT